LGRPRAHFSPFHDRTPPKYGNQASKNPISTKLP
jgi:hypothetical protein